MTFKQSLRATTSIVAVLVAASCQTAAPDRFSAADTDHSGALTAAEANALLVTQLFDSRDLDKDGSLTESEWVVGGDPAQKKQFRASDGNHDGKVSREEAIAHGQKQGMAGKLVREADTDKNGTVSRDEMTAYYGSKEGLSR
jgi:hypothetical protein